MNRFHHEKPPPYTALQGRIVTGNVSTSHRDKLIIPPFFAMLKSPFHSAAIIPIDHLMRFGGRQKQHFECQSPKRGELTRA
tara:strand:+ start:620 stop:862 length:243 start_codon:yes stop_codon:yes gene_type:complete